MMPIERYCTAIVNKYIMIVYYAKSKKNTMTLGEYNIYLINWKNNNFMLFYFSCINIYNMMSYIYPHMDILMRISVPNMSIRLWKTHICNIMSTFSTLHIYNFEAMITAEVHGWVRWMNGSNTPRPPGYAVSTRPPDRLVVWWVIKLFCVSDYVSEGLTVSCIS